MITEIPNVLQVVCHCEGGQTNVLNCRCFFNLVCNGAIPSELGVQQGPTRVVQGAEAVDLTVSDHFLTFGRKIK